MFADVFHKKDTRLDCKKLDIKPEIGMLNNRDKNPRGRHVLNWDNFIEAVKQKYPETTWINIRGYEMENLSYSVKKFAATKYFIAVAESGPQNAILMKPGTGITMIGVNFINHRSISGQHMQQIRDLFIIQNLKKIWNIQCTSQSI